LYTLSDPFIFSLNQTKVMTVITEDRLENFRFRPLYDFVLGQFPFTGTVLARFEKSDLPEHKHRPGVVVRVLEILSPINCVISDYDYNTQMPEVGQFIAKRKLSGRYGNYHPWSIDISENTAVAKSLRLLFPESTLSSFQKCGCIRYMSIYSKLMTIENLFLGGQAGWTIGLHPFA